MSETDQAKNTDRELWREKHPEGEAYSYYAPSIHVTERGGIGINVGGAVYVKSLRDWHALAAMHQPRQWDEDREARAKAIYDEMPFDGPGTKPAWVPHGNSRKQDEARDLADTLSSTPSPQ